MNKKEIRQNILEKRRQLSLEEVFERSEIIINKLKSMQEFQQSHKIMVYVSFDNEVYTHGLINELLAGGKKIFVPYLENNEMHCSFIDSFDEFIEGHYGILEPKIIRNFPSQDLDVIIAPGVAFDKNNNRIGYGAGYYDWFFKKTTCLKIALAYNFQVVEEINTDPYDVFLDKIISD